MRNDPTHSWRGLVWTFLVLGIPVAVAALLLASTGPVLSRVVTDALIKLTMVVGLYIFIGNSGIFSFGHAAFIVVGSYASAWMTIPPTFKKVILPGLPAFMQAIHLDPFTGGLVGVLLAVLLAFVIGLALMRLAGIAASIASFAFFSVIVVIYNNWTGWTKGTASLVGLPVYAGPKLALAAALVAMLLALLFQHSRYGLLLRATREDAAAARAAGVEVERMRLIAFVVSAAVVAAGGVLQGHFNGALTTTANVHLNLTFLILAMLVVGGMRSLAGAVIGVAILAFVAELLRQLERGWQIGDLTITAPSGLGQVGLGIVMLVVRISRPQGLTRGREIPMPGWLSRRERQGDADLIESTQNAR